MSRYRVRHVKIGTREQLDELAQECGQLYSQTLVSFWRTVRRKGVWLKPKHLMRWHTSKKLHAHTADACVQAFFAALKQLRGLLYYHAAVDPGTYTVVNVSIWTDLDSARQMDTLAPMLAQRPILEQAGVQFDRIANYEPLWSIQTHELDWVSGSASSSQE